MNLFELIYPRFRFDKSKTIRLFEAFSGVGCQAMALKRITDNVELIGFSEIDKSAIRSYKAIHGEVKNYGDITKMGTIPECDIFTYLFPCTDLSLAGKQKGMGEGTRSGLVREVLRLLRNTEAKPKVLIMENVPALISEKFVQGFNAIQSELEELGYTNYNEVLNAKDFGVPQNRARIFMVSILGDEKNKHYSYDFPFGEKLNLQLKDKLEEEVDEKYYLNRKTLERISHWKAQQDPLKNIEKEKTLSPTLTARGAGEEHSGMVLISEQKDVSNAIRSGGRGSVDRHSWDLVVGKQHTPELVQVAQLGGYESTGRVYGEDGLCPTISAMGEGQREPKIMVKTSNEKTKVYKTKELDMPRDRIYDEKNVCFTITTMPNLQPYIMQRSPGWNKGGIYDNCPTITSNGFQDNNHLLIPEATARGYAEASDGDGVYINRPEQKRGCVQKGMIQTLKTSGNDVGVMLSVQVQPKDRDYNAKGQTREERLEMRNDGLSGTLVTHADRSLVMEEKSMEIPAENGDGEVIEIDGKAYYRVSDKLYRIRKLTPLECWRLMGISDEDYWKAKNAGMAKPQLYKQAGNGIVVDVFEAILRELIETEKGETKNV